MRYSEILEAVVKLGKRYADEGSPARQFLDDFKDITRANPLNDRERLLGPVKIEISSYGNMSVRIHDIQSMARGAGSEALKTLCDLADKYGVTLKLTAFGYAQTPTETLIKWYKKYGFVVTDEEEDSADMMRDPK